MSRFVVNILRPFQGTLVTELVKPRIKKRQFALYVSLWMNKGKTIWNSGFSCMRHEIHFPIYIGRMICHMPHTHKLAIMSNQAIFFIHNADIFMLNTMLYFAPPESLFWWLMLERVGHEAKPGSEWIFHWSDLRSTNTTYRNVYNIRRTLVGNKIVDRSDVVGASPVDETYIRELTVVQTSCLYSHDLLAVVAVWDAPPKVSGIKLSRNLLFRTIHLGCLIVFIFPRERQRHCRSLCKNPQTIWQLGNK